MPLSRPQIRERAAIDKQAAGRLDGDDRGPGRENLTAEEHCRPHLAAYKLPRSVRFVPDLPKTSTGKVMRRELKTLDR